MKEELKKNLTDLIDETLLELEELKKSRFSAAEIEIKGPGADSLAGKPVNGKLGAEKAEDKKDEGEPETDEADDAEKAEETEKAEDKKDEEKAEEKKDEAAPEKKEEDKKDEPKEFPFKKSLDDMESLMKSYVDDKFNSLQTQMANVLAAVNKLANAPVPAKGVSYKGVAPLMKSADAVEPLTKSEVANKLFELKKSGSRVDSADIARAEMGHDLEKIVSKYGIQ